LPSLFVGSGILYFFGWAELDKENWDSEGSVFAAPFRWYYCMFLVAIFLVTIEIFKLIAVRFCVWTKR
jgi:hypothetical protein